MLRHSLGFCTAVLGALAISTSSPAAAGTFAKGFALPGDGYRLIEAELIDRRTGRFEFWQQRHDRDSAGDEMATFGNLTMRRNGNWQTSMGLGSYGVQGQNGAAFTNLQLKQMWHQPHRDGYGLGWAAGLHYDYSNEEHHDQYLLIPASAPWGKRTTLHANLGAVHDRQARETEGLWALGLDWRLTQSWDVILQFSDVMDSNTKTDGVFGLRRTMFHDLVELDLAYGRKMTSGAHDEFYLGISFDAIRF